LHTIPINLTLIMLPVAPWSSIEGGFVIQKETAPMRSAMFYYKMKVINQNNFVLIYSDFAF